MRTDDYNNGTPFVECAVYALILTVVYALFCPWC
jgi:hypothetical protein